MTKQEAIQSQIDNIMDSFDFGMVARVMEFLNWEWRQSEEGVPKEYEIRSSARKHLNEVAECGLSFLKSGGLCAGYAEGCDDETGDWVRVSFSFEIEDWDVDGVSYGE